MINVDMINIGISSLSAYRTALSVASDNIANANTEYYSRRMADFVEGSFGMGVNIADVRRIFDANANQAAQVSQSNFSQMDTYYQQLKNLEPLFDANSNPNTLGKYLTDSLNALRTLDSDVSFAQGRGEFMGKLNNLVLQFQNANTEIVRQANNINQSLQTDTDAANAVISSLEKINAQLLSNSLTNPAEMFDQRDKLIHDLASYVNFNAVTDDKGIVTISLSNGTPLLFGTQISPLKTYADPDNSSNLLVGVLNGTTTLPVGNLINSGKMSGLINFRQNGILPAQQALGRLSLAISDSFNRQNKLGIDADGLLGGNIFNDINSTALINQRTAPNSFNVGSSVMSVNIDTVGQLLGGDYRLVIGTANQYTLTRLSDNATVQSGTLSGTFPETMSADGFTINIASGTFTAGDQYTISPTYNAVGQMGLAINDTAKLALGWPVMVSGNPPTRGAITLEDMTDTTTSAFSTSQQLNPPLTIKFTSTTTYDLIDAKTSAVLESGIAYDPNNPKNEIFPTPGNYNPGYKVYLSGKMQDQDTFNIAYNTKVTSDNRNGLAMERLYSNRVLQGPSGQVFTFNEAFNALSTAVSITTSSAKSGYDYTQKAKTTADKNRDQISGVSLEEESMNLARFQQAYQASAQILQTAKALFDIVISITR